MKFAYTLGGGAPHNRKFKVDEDLATAGIPVLTAGSGDRGVNAATTTGAADTVGITLDTAVLDDTPGTEGIVTVTINPDAVYRIRMSGTAATGGALLTTTQTAASTTIVTITTGDPVPNSNTMLDGMIACISGANWGQTRKITAVAATTATVTTARVRSAASRDVFLLVPVFPGATQDLGGTLGTLTTTLDEANCLGASTTSGIEFRVVDVEFDFATQTFARNQSYVYAMAGDHIYKLNT